MARTNKRYRRKKLRGGKRKRRKTNKKQKRQRRKRTKRRVKKRRKRTKRRRRYQRGGNLLAPATFKCNSSQNIGEKFTGVKYNENPALSHPKYSKNVQKGGASWVQDFGWSDAQRLGYSALDGAKNLQLRYTGGKPLISNSPMVQPGLQSIKHDYKPADINKIHNDSSATAASI